MAGTIQVSLIPTAYTLLGSGPMQISNSAPIGIAASGTGAPVANAAFTALAAGDRPHAIPQSEVFYGIALQQNQPGQPTVVVNVGVTT